MGLHHSDAGRRGDLYLAVATLFRTRGPQLTERERTLTCDILRRLADNVAAETRTALAERLADDPAAPRELILLLIDDRLDIARPLILRSTVLNEDDLLDIVRRADDARNVLCAKRAGIGEKLTAELARTSSEPVLLALVRNVTARFAADTLDTLVHKVRHLPSLRKTLGTRPEMLTSAATAVCGTLSDAQKDGSNEDAAPADLGTGVPLDESSPELPSTQRSATPTGARKLVEKMAVAGQLGAGFLLRVLQQGQTELFDLAFAKMLDLEVDTFRRSFYAKDPKQMALACRAAGIDRSVFPTVFGLSAQSCGRSATLRPKERVTIRRVFDLARPEALARVRA